MTYRAKPTFFWLRVSQALRATGGQNALRKQPKVAAVRQHKEGTEPLVLTCQAVESLGGRQPVPVPEVF
jgi:hypothetical protein